MNGERIKDIRKKLGLSQEAFAHFIGVAVKTVNFWENGKSNPSRLAVEKLEMLDKRGKE